jgi:TonB family protein
VLAGVVLFGSATTVAHAQGDSTRLPSYIYTPGEVDKSASRVDDGVQPKYPDALRALAVGGQVLTMFVVDTNGRVDTTSVMTDPSAQPLFVASVKEALALTHFVPAEKAGRRVPEYVQQAFTFRIDAPPVNVDSILEGAGTKLDVGPAAVMSGSARPRYPEAARLAGYEGEVIAQFVIDSTGHADPKTFKVIRARAVQTMPPPAVVRTMPSQHPGEIPEGPTIQAMSPGQASDLFVEAVRDALPNMRFIPAGAHGHKVRQLVQQPFTFGLSR